MEYFFEIVINAFQLFFLVGIYAVLKALNKNQVKIGEMQEKYNAKIAKRMRIT